MIVGVVASTLLVLVALATHHGLILGVTTYTGQDDISFWITRRGTDNLIRSSAMLRDDLMGDIAAVPGVAVVSPLVRGFVTARSATSEQPSESRNLLAIGYLAPAGLGGPPLFHRGRAPETDREVALDRAAAHRLGVTVGEEILVGSRSYRVVGLTRNTNLLATQFAFFHIDALRRSSGLPDRVSFLAVGLAPGAEASTVGEQLESALPQIAVHPRQSFVSNNVREVASGFRPVQNLLLAISLLVAGVLTALLVQGTVEDRSRDVAVLFAMGASATSVARSVLRETLTLVVLGVLLGEGAVQALRALLELLLPTVEIAPRWTDPLLVLPIFLSVAALAAWLPLQRLRAIDPLEAFRP